MRKLLFYKSFVLTLLTYEYTIFKQLRVRDAVSGCTELVQNEPNLSMYKFNGSLFQRKSFCAYQRKRDLQTVIFQKIRKHIYIYLKNSLLKNPQGQNIYHINVECVKCK